MNSNIDAQLPLIDLHRHLDGSVRLETILDLGRQHNLALPARDPESVAPARAGHGRAARHYGLYRQIQMDDRGSGRLRCL